MDEKRFFKDLDKAKRWNERIKAMPNLNKELVIDTTSKSLEEVANQIMEFTK